MRSHLGILYFPVRLSILRAPYISQSQLEEIFLYFPVTLLLIYLYILQISSGFKILRQEHLWVNPAHQ